MKTKQLGDILVKVSEEQGSIPLRVVVNGVAFPIHQRFYMRGNGAGERILYIVANMEPKLGNPDVVLPEMRRTRRKSRGE